MKYEGITIKGIEKTVKNYMERSNMGGIILYDKENGEVEYIDACYNSFKYRNIMNFYNFYGYYDVEDMLICLDNLDLYNAEEAAIGFNEGRMLGYADISKIIINQIVKQVKAI